MSVRESICQHSVNVTPPFPYFALPPQKNAILGQVLLKIHANINIPISALNVRESSEIEVKKHDGDVRFQTRSRNKVFCTFALKSVQYNANLSPNH